MNTRTLSLDTDRGATTAHVAVSDGDSPRKAVILIQEWWGVNDHIRDLAERYAQEGYLSIAPDLYRGKLTRDAAEASRFMKELAPDDGVATIKRTVEEVKNMPGVESVAITGYCMGGTFALLAACEIPELAASAPFYGDIPEEDVLSHLTVPTLFIAGKRDGWITPQKVQGLSDAAAKYNLPVEVLSYDADHAFFNDTRPEVYDPTAAADAWKRVLEFFGRRVDSRQ